MENNKKLYPRDVRKHICKNLMNNPQSDDESSQEGQISDNSGKYNIEKIMHTK